MAAAALCIVHVRACPRYKSQDYSIDVDVAMRRGLDLIKRDGQVRARHCNPARWQGNLQQHLVRIYFLKLKTETKGKKRRNKRLSVCWLDTRGDMRGRGHKFLCNLAKQFRSQTSSKTLSVLLKAQFRHLTQDGTPHHVSLLPLSLSLPLSLPLSLFVSLKLFSPLHVCGTLPVTLRSVSTGKRHAPTGNSFTTTILMITTTLSSVETITTLLWTTCGNIWLATRFATFLNVAYLCTWGAGS